MLIGAECILKEKVQRDVKRQQASSTASKNKMWNVPDDFPDIQSAIDHCSPGDGIFVFPAEYEILEPLLIHKSVHIIGVDDVGTSAVIRYRTDAPHLSMLRILSNNVRLKGVTLEQAFTEKTSQGNDVLVPALEPLTPRRVAVVVGESAQNVVLDECIISGEQCHGLLVSEKTYVTLLCCKISSPNGCAVYCDGKLFVDRSDISNSQLGALFSHHADATLKSSCFVGCSQGFAIESHGHIEAVACVISNCMIGVTVDEDILPPKTSSIRGCEFVDCSAASIVVIGTEPAADIHKNFFHGTSRNGVVTRGSTQRVDIRANAFKSLSGVGVRVISGNPIVEANLFEGCGVAGVKVDSCRPIIRLNEFVRNVAPSPLNGKSVAVWVDGTAAVLSPLWVYDSLHSEVKLTGYLRNEEAAGIKNRAAKGYKLSPEEQTTLAQSEEAEKLERLLHHPPVEQFSTQRSCKSDFAARNTVAVTTASVSTVITPPPDPHVEGNVFGENQHNVRVELGSGTFMKNEMLVSVDENVIIEGYRPSLPAETAPESPTGNMFERLKASAEAEEQQRIQANRPQPKLPEFPATFTNNEIRGSVLSHVVSCGPGAFASFAQNEIGHGTKGYGVLLDSCRFVEVKENKLSHCQGGALGRGKGSCGKIVSNDFDNLSLYVQLEAQDTIYAAGNTNVADFNK